MKKKKITTAGGKVLKTSKGAAKVEDKAKGYDDLFAEKNMGVRINLGAGETILPGWVNVDFRSGSTIDIVQDLTMFPWDIPDDCATIVMASHLLEHINPVSANPQLAGLLDLLLSKKVITKEEVEKQVGEYRFLSGFIRFMDEVWRILKPEGQFMISIPFAGSTGYWQDPSHCLQSGSDVLSLDGFKKITDVQIGEKILTRNMETGKSEWSKVLNVTNEDYKGEMVRFQHQMMDISVTPNHDMVWGTHVSKNSYKGRADEFPQSGRVGYASITNWEGENPTRISIKDTGTQEKDPNEFEPSDFMALLGWIVSEGCFVVQNGGTQKYVQIYQGSSVNQENYEEIESLIKRMGFKYHAYERRFDICSDNLYEELYEIGKQDTRFVPPKYKKLNKTLLTAFLASAIKGDGEEMRKSDGHIYTSISHHLSEDVQEIAAKCGFRTSLKKREGKQFVSVNGKTYTRKDQYRVSIFEDRPVYYPSPKKEYYDGKIECVTVENNHTIFVRQNGYTLWTGNCNPINQITWAYFDPLIKDPKNGQYVGLYPIYRPFPWKVVSVTYDNHGFMETLLEKRRIDRSYNVSKNNGLSI